MKELEIPLKDKIYTIRGKQVMLDRDLAQLYGVETKALNRQVKRNKNRFPEDFCFQLTNDEMLRCQNVTSSHGGRRYLPFVFTEHGVTALAGVLKSDIAEKISVNIVRSFIALRKIVAEHSLILQKFQQIDQKLLTHDKNFEEIFKVIQSKQLTPKQGIFYDGQIYDAHVFVSNLIKQAKKDIILIDPYIDTSVLTLMSHKAKDVKVVIYTKELSEKLKLAENKFNKQYGNLTIKEFTKSHDRFLVIDSKIYHIGASLKDLGKKWFAFSKMDLNIIKNLQLT